MKNHRTDLIVIALYTLLTLLLTWPMALNLATHIPGEATWAFDESTFIWNMWWLKHSILNLQQTPLVSTYTFFPLGVNLTTYTFNLFNAALGLPLQLALSLPPASSLTLIFSYVSSAYGTYLLVRYLIQSSASKSETLMTRSAAFTAGTVFAFSASRMMYVALGHYNFVTIQWFPYYVLFLLKTLRDGTLKNMVMAGLFATFCLYAELTFSVFLLFLTAIILINQFFRQQAISRKPIIQVVFIGLVTFILTAPFILSVLPDFLDPAYNQPGWGEGLKLSADLVGLVTLTPLHPLSGLDWISELRAVIEGDSRFSDANTLFLGYGILAFALLGFVTHRRKTAVWLWMALIFTILSLGPLLTINGQHRFDMDGIEATFPMPFALLHYIPILSANRVPNRFGIPLTLVLAVLVGYGTVWLLARLRNTQIVAVPVTVVLLALLLFDQYSVPLPLTDARIPGAYYEIGAEPDNFTIMQLPLGWRNSYGTLGSERTQLQYYQAAHRRPMLGGNTSRNPQFKFDYYANIPLFKALTAAELYQNVDDATLQQAQQQAAELMTLYNVKYLVVHDPIPFRKPYEDTFIATRNLALELIPHQPNPIYQSPGVEVFAVQQAEIPNPLIIDFGDPASDPYRGVGWAGNENIFAATANWAIAENAEIFFPVRGNGDRQMALEIAPFSYPDNPTQQISFELNGEILEKFSLHEQWQSLNIQLPEESLVHGLNRLMLNFSHTAQPRNVLPANRGIGSTGIETPTDIEVNSGADFAFITVGFGQTAQDASTHRRGINIAIVDPQTGTVEASKGFDTAANEFEAAALGQFISTIADGQIVIVAGQGLDATAFFDENTWLALQSLGVATDSLSLPFSAIGVKGMPAGTAQQASGDGTAYIRLGANPDVRNLAAAVNSITISIP